MRCEEQSNIVVDDRHLKYHALVIEHDFENDNEGFSLHFLAYFKLSSS